MLDDHRVVRIVRESIPTQIVEIVNIPLSYHYHLIIFSRVWIIVTLHRYQLVQDFEAIYMFNEIIFHHSPMFFLLQY